MGKKNWRNKIVYSLYIFVIVNILVCIERIVFDVFGQMWITLAVNGLTGLASIVCILGIYFRKKSAIIAFIVCCLLTLGVNVVIILIYNEVGLLKGTEQYLSLPLKSESWWSNHGFLCYPICQNNNNNNNNNHGAGDTGSGGVSLIDGTLLLNDGLSPTQDYGSGEGQLMQACFISYKVIESFHASLNILLIVITIMLSLLMILKEEAPPEEEKFKYVGIGRYGGDAPTNNKRQQTYYKLSDSFDTLATARSNSNASSSSSM